MVAVDDVDLQAGHVLFKLLQALGDDLMALKLAVLCEVAGDKQHIGPVFPDCVQQLKVYSVALREHLAVAVEGRGEVLGVLDHGGRHIVYVAEYGDLQAFVVLSAVVAGCQRGQDQRAGHDENEKHGEKTPYAGGFCHSLFSFTVVHLVADGCVEIQLTGQDCGCYGFDTGTNLAELVQRILDEVPGDYKMRLGMGNPRHMLRYTDSLLKCFDDERVYKFIHLPVQSGSEDILKAMNRKHSAQDYVDLAEAFNRIPRFTLSTDLIVGFPGESERDFLDTLALLEKTRPTVCNITRFVPRPNTPAYNMTGAVPDSIKHERSAALAEAFQQIAAQNNSRWIGTTETVVIEKNGYRKGTYIARNAAYRPVAITSEVPLQPGKRFTVTITAAEPFALIGERI